MKYLRIRDFLTGLLIALAIFSTPYAYRQYSDSNIELLRADLYNNPMPSPGWILEIAPEPGSILKVSDAHFGEGDDPFWPGWGVTCVQIDGLYLDFNPQDLHQRSYFEINGARIYRIHPKLLFDKLIYNLEIEPGFISTSFSDNGHDINICLNMRIEPGLHLASYHISRVNKPDLEYQWSFELIP